LLISIAISLALHLFAGRSKAAGSESGPTTESVMIPVTEDTFISSGHPHTNYGYEESLRLGDYSGAQYRTLLEFDVASHIPSGATIHSADLRLHPIYFTLNTIRSSSFIQDLWGILYNFRWRSLLFLRSLPQLHPQHIQRLRNRANESTDSASIYRAMFNACARITLSFE